MTDSVAEKLHAESIVIDAVCPLVKYDPQYLDWYREGGVTVVAPSLTVGTQNAREAMDALAMWHRLFRERSDLLLVRQASDVELAKQSGRLGIYLHCQGADALYVVAPAFVELGEATLGNFWTPREEQNGEDGTNEIGAE